MTPNDPVLGGEPAFTTETLQAALDSSPFIAFTAVQVEEMDSREGRLVLGMPFRRELARIAGSKQFHGGAVSALIDTAACFGIVMALRIAAPTVDLRTDYLRPATGERLRAAARIRKLGRTVAVADVDVTDESGALVAIGRGTFGTAGGGGR